MSLNRSNLYSQPRHCIYRIWALCLTRGFSLHYLFVFTFSSKNTWQQWMQNTLTHLIAAQKKRFTALKLLSPITDKTTWSGEKYMFVSDMIKSYNVRYWGRCVFFNFTSRHNTPHSQPITLIRTFWNPIPSTLKLTRYSLDSFRASFDAMSLGLLFWMYTWNWEERGKCLWLFSTTVWKTLHFIFSTYIPCLCILYTYHQLCLRHYLWKTYFCKKLIS